MPLPQARNSVAWPLPADPRAAVAKSGRIHVADKADRTVDGIVFASKFEARVYGVLKGMVRADKLHLQPAFELQPAFKDQYGKHIRAIQYKSDFLIGNPRTGASDPLEPEHIVIDAKGMPTEVYLMKLKMFRYHFREGTFVEVSRVRQLADIAAIIPEKWKIPTPLQSRTSVKPSRAPRKKGATSA